MTSKLHTDDVTAVLVTRGDCDLTPIYESLIFKNIILWDNSKQLDLGAFGRYAAIAANETNEVIYVQDDDCLIDPADQYRLLDAYEPGTLAALMPPTRSDYTDTVLIGWGALFDRNLPGLAFKRWADAGFRITGHEFCVVQADFVFPMLTKHVRLDAEHVDLPHAHASNRTWGSYPHYAAVKERTLRQARIIRDGS